MLLFVMVAPAVQVSCSRPMVFVHELRLSLTNSLSLSKHYCGVCGPYIALAINYYGHGSLPDLHTQFW